MPFVTSRECVSVSVILTEKDPELLLKLNVMLNVPFQFIQFIVPV